MSKQQFRDMADRVGLDKVASATHLVTQLGGIIGAPPGITLALLARSSQEDLTGSKTLKEVVDLLFPQFALYVQSQVARATAETGKAGTIDLSFIKEMAEVTEVAQELREVMGEAEGYAIPLETYVPGNGTLH